MEKGRSIFDTPTLEDIRKRASENLSFLPPEYKQINNPPAYPVQLSDALKSLVTRLERQITQKEIEAVRH